MNVSAIMRDFPLDHRLTREEAPGWFSRRSSRPLLAAAARRRDAAHGRRISYSRKVFIPLTQLCRDVCHYCTFAHAPRSGESRLSLARPGDCDCAKRAARPAARRRCSRSVTSRSCATAPPAKNSTGSGIRRRCPISRKPQVRCFARPDCSPHINPGLMTGEDIDALRKVSVSQGIMLESVSERLCEKGGAHFGSPDKIPAARLETMRLAGERSVPFTSGILIGIGETREERIDALFALRDLHDTHGHIQEIIIQNFRPKPGTRMAEGRTAEVEDHLWTIAMARLIFEPAMNIQAPPNLSPGALRPDGRRRDQRLGRGFAGHAGPRQSRSAVAASAGAGGCNQGRGHGTRPSGLRSIPRSPAILRAGSILRFASRYWTASMPTACRGSMRGARDMPGNCRRANSIGSAGPAQRSPRKVLAACSRARSAAKRWARARSSSCFVRAAMISPPFAAPPTSCGATSTATSSAMSSTRNINYTNICSFKCQFCAFSKGKMSENLRGRPYDLEMAEIAGRVSEAWARGASEVCMQGGIHPVLYRAEISRDLPGGEASRAADPSARVFAAGDIPGRADAGHSRDRLSRRVEGGRPRHAARHGGGNPRRRGAGGTVRRQDPHCGNGSM